MTRKETALTAAILVANLLLGITLARKADLGQLFASTDTREPERTAAPANDGRVPAVWLPGSWFPNQGRAVPEHGDDRLALEGGVDHALPQPAPQPKD